MVIQLQVWMTRDGILHKTREEAASHASRVYSRELSLLAGELVRVEKHTKMMEWLDANLSRFQQLDALRRDCEVSQEADESCGDDS